MLQHYYLLIKLVFKMQLIVGHHITNKGVISMKAYAKILAIILAVVTFTMFASCSSTQESTETQEEFEGFFVQPSGYIELEDSLNDCINNADIIVMGTVSNVGASFLPTNLSLNDSMSDIEKKEIVRQIKTPITFNVQDVYKNAASTSDSLASSLSENSTLSFNEHHGVIDNAYKLYPLEHQIELEENMTYVLFIKIIDGTYYVLYQPSILINEDGSFESLLMNTQLYTDCGDSSEAIELLENLLD